VNFNQVHFQKFETYYKSVPIQDKVGRIPKNVFKTIKNYFPEKDWPEDNLINHKLTRAELRKISKSENEIAAFICIMAWGGIRISNLRLALKKSVELKKIVKKLKGSKFNRIEAFALLQKAKRQRELQGLGISFYTKLLHFFRPDGDAYILDQWTAKSMVLLLGNNSPVVLHGDLPCPQTSPRHYEEYCLEIEQVAKYFKWSGADVETGLFSKGGKKPNRWRKYVKTHFPRK
jgi:hypothetical protein